MAPHRSTRRVRWGNPNSSLVTIPDSATYVMLDAPDRLAGAITEFIKPG
jgi:pimeloyl-ACP methyl ester carboxylesterase